MLKQDSIFVIAVRTGPVVQSYRWDKWRRGDRETRNFTYTLSIRTKLAAPIPGTIYHLVPCTLFLVQGLSIPSLFLFVLAHTSIVQLFGGFDFFICRSQLFFNINMIWKMNVSNCRTMHKSTINPDLFCSSPLNNGFGGFRFPQPHVCITLVVSRIKFIHGRFHSTSD